MTTDLVPLLFVAMIPIDCKITNFSLHLFMYPLKKVHMPVSLDFLVEESMKSIFSCH